MSGEKTGVQIIIRHNAPLATYMHCSSHALNLVIAHSCQLTSIRNMMDKLTEAWLFFNASPKRDQLLRDIILVECPDVSKRKPLLNLCKTRWAERHVAYQHFYQAYTYQVKALELIALGLHDDHGYNPDPLGGWDSHSKSRASSLLDALTKFDFIVPFLTVYNFLSHMDGITKKMQAETNGIIQAFLMIDDVKMTYSMLREDIEQSFSHVYNHAVRLAAAVDVEPVKPRITSRQQNRSNAPAESHEAYYRKNMAVPFVDHILVELDSQFTGLSQQSASLLGLVPAIFCEKHTDITVAAELYHDELPSPELLISELFRWKTKFESLPVSQRPTSCASALMNCDETFFPNIHILLRIACTLPCTSCECERSFSVMRRLRTYLRCSMTGDRLTSLALMHIHYNYEIDLEEVVTKFEAKHPRRLDLSKNLIYL